MIVIVNVTDILFCCEILTKHQIILSYIYIFKTRYLVLNIIMFSLKKIITLRVEGNCADKKKEALIFKSEQLHEQKHLFIQEQYFFDKLL